MQLGNGAVAGTISARDLSNTGYIAIYGGSTGQSLFSVAADAPATWTGTVNISGDGLLEFGGTGQIGSIASGAQIALQGTQAFVAAAGIGTAGNTALTGLTSNAGYLTLQSGAALPQAAG